MPYKQLREKWNIKGRSHRSSRRTEGMLKKQDERIKAENFPQN